MGVIFLYREKGFLSMNDFVFLCSRPHPPTGRQKRPERWQVRLQNGAQDNIFRYVLNGAKNKGTNPYPLPFRPVEGDYARREKVVFIGFVALCPENRKSPTEAGGRERVCYLIIAGMTVSTPVITVNGLSSLSRISTSW